MLTLVAPRIASPRLRCTVLTGDQWLSAWHDLPPATREVYYHPQFAAAAARWEGARPECLLIESTRGQRLLYPYLRHAILGYESVAGPCCDVQTPYGYGGPLFIGDWDHESQERALAAVADHLRQSGAIAEFVRCHTEWTDADLLREAGYRTPVVRTNVEYQPPHDSLCAVGHEWANGPRFHIKKAQRLGLRYRTCTDPADLAAFEHIYALTADRLQMAPAYRFDHDYFASLLALGPRTVKLILVETPDNRPAAAAIVFLAGRLAHFHLSGQDMTLQSMRPGPYLYWAAAREAAAHGCDRIIWGGGTTNDPEDSLFLFKFQYGRVRTPVHIATRVFDEDRYHAICDEWSRLHPDKATTTKLFLKYRA